MLSLISLAGPAAAADNYSLSTEVVASYTTFCPTATTFTAGSLTYTAKDSETLTLTDGPYTRTHTYWTETVTVCPTSASVSASPSTAPSSKSSGVPLASSSGTNPVPSIANGGNGQQFSLSAMAVGALVLAHLL